MTHYDDTNIRTKSYYKDCLISIYKIEDTGHKGLYKALEDKNIKEKLLNDDSFILTKEIMNEYI